MRCAIAKRFTDTCKWDDPWFLDLTNEEKLLWIYILDKCDVAGVFKLNTRMIEFCIGRLDIHKFISSAGDRLRMLEGDKYLVSKFITFQYGVLTEKNKIYKSIITALTVQGLNKGDLSPIDGGKDKDNINIQDKVKDKKGGCKGGFKKPTKDELSEYFIGRGLEAATALVEAQKFLDRYESVGWVIGKARTPMKSWPGAASTWFQNWQEWGVESRERGKDGGQYLTKAQEHIKAGLERMNKKHANRNIQSGGGADFDLLPEQKV